MTSLYALTFPWNEIEKLLQELHSAKTVRPLWGTETGKGFWLVGDQGVYMMANTSDGALSLARKDRDNAFVVYADQCDPTKMEFDQWWAAKRRTFGGDDGVEFIALDAIEKLVSRPPRPGLSPLAVSIDIAPQQFSIEIVWP